MDVPLVKEARFVTGMTVHVSTSRVWTPEEVALIEEVAERTWAAVEQTRAETAVRLSEKKYRTLFDSMDEGYCVIEMIFDPARSEHAIDYRFLEVNRAFEDQSGMRSVVGRRMLEFVPSIEKHWLANYSRVALSGEPIRFANEYKTLNRWFDVYAFRVGSPDERKVAVLFTDITEKVRGIEREATQKTLATLIERCPFGIYIVDDLFRIASMNERSQSGAFANVRPAIGRPFDEAMHILWPEPVATEIIGNFRRTLDTGVPYFSRDFVNPRTDIDQTEGYEWELHRITLPSGQFGVVCYYYDATKLRQVEQALKEADRRKDEFLATLAHELRNPLAPLRNGLQVLKLTDDTVAAEKARSMMERQLGQMVRLVDDLLDISRITRNKLEMRTARIDLWGVVKSALETARPQIEARGHTLTVTLPPYPVYLDGDLTRLAQVFWNLLDNSAKYTEPGGRINLTAELRENEAVVTVQDSGIGIPAKDLLTLFEMFSQVDHSLERAEGGLGIGLALVKGLTEAHGGNVQAYSEGVGHGSTFVVRLPVVLDTSVPTPEKSSGDANTVPRHRILVVDDNRDGAASLAMLLSLMGQDTRTAHDGIEGVEMAEAFRPELIVLDIGLPRLNGFDACRRIRQMPWAKNIVIVAATGWGQEEDRRRSHEAGFDYHFVKPVDPAEVVRLLSAVGR
ncbi:MAG: ATP-binding protein [Gemmatales bacterium]